MARKYKGSSKAESAKGKERLFVTEDGVAIYEGMPYFVVDSDFVLIINYIVYE